MPYALGVDIGTSSVTTAIARLSDGDAEPLSHHRSARFPATLFVDDRAVVHVGDAAETRGRVEPERVVRAVVGRIGDDVPIVAGGGRFAAEHLYAVIARSAVDRITAGEGAVPDAVRVVIPSGWGSHRISVVQHALADVGLADATLVTGADAAATAWGGVADIPDGDAAIAVYDLGATRFQVTVLQRSEGILHAVAVDGADDIGGADVDDAVLRHVVASAGELFADFGSGDADASAAIAALRAECVRAKEVLSTESETTVEVRLPARAGEVVLDRAALERITEAAVRATLPVLGRAMRAAGVEADRLSALILVGGTTRMPLVSRILTEESGCRVVSDGEPEVAAARGAAISAASSLGRQEDVGEVVVPEDDAPQHPLRLAGLGRGAANALRVLRRGTGAVAAAMAGIVGAQTDVDGDRTGGDRTGGSDPGGTAV